MSRVPVLVLGVTALALLLASGSPGPAAAVNDDTITVDLPASDVIYDPVSGKLFASVLAAGGDAANSITVIDPHTGEVGPSVFIGSAPGSLALSGDGQYIYASLATIGAVRRFDIATLEAGPQFYLGNGNHGPYLVEDMEVVPGDPHAVAVARMSSGVSPRHAGVAIYGDGVQRTDTTPGHTGSNTIVFSDDPSVLFGYNNETTEYGLRTMTVGETGVTVDSNVEELIRGFRVKIEFAGGLLYATNGRVVDPVAQVIVGSYPADGSVVPDAAAGRVFFLDDDSIDAFDMDTFAPAGSISVPGPDGANLVRWGDDGFAYHTGDKVVIIRSSLVHGEAKPTATPSPTPTRTPTRTPAPTRTPLPPPHLGDANCDGRVTSLDASVVLQFSAYLVDHLPCPLNADMTGNGYVNVLDAFFILAYVAGYILLPAG